MEEIIHDIDSDETEKYDFFFLSFVQGLYKLDDSEISSNKIVVQRGDALRGISLKTVGIFLSNASMTTNL